MKKIILALAALIILGFSPGRIIMVSSGSPETEIQKPKPPPKPKTPKKAPKPKTSKKPAPAKHPKAPPKPPGVK
jgi:hypothetical protein